MANNIPKQDFIDLVDFMERLRILDKLPSIGELYKRLFPFHPHEQEYITETAVKVLLHVDGATHVLKGKPSFIVQNDTEATFAREMLQIMFPKFENAILITHPNKNGPPEIEIPDELHRMVSLGISVWREFQSQAGQNKISFTDNLPPGLSSRMPELSQEFAGSRSVTSLPDVPLTRPSHEFITLENYRVVAEYIRNPLLHSQDKDGMIQAETWLGYIDAWENGVKALAPAHVADISREEKDGGKIVLLTVPATVARNVLLTVDRMNHIFRKDGYDAAIAFIEENQINAEEIIAIRKAASLLTDPVESGSRKISFTIASEEDAALLKEHIGKLAPIQDIWVGNEAIVMPEQAWQEIKENLDTFVRTLDHQGIFAALETIESFRESALRTRESAEQKSDADWQRQNRHSVEDIENAAFAPIAYIEAVLAKLNVENGAVLSIPEVFANSSTKEKITVTFDAEEEAKRYQQDLQALAPRHEKEITLTTEEANPRTHSSAQYKVIAPNEAKMEATITLNEINQEISSKGIDKALNLIKTTTLQIDIPSQKVIQAALVVGKFARKSSSASLNP